MVSLSLCSVFKPTDLGVSFAEGCWSKKKKRPYTAAVVTRGEFCLVTTNTSYWISYWNHYKRHLAKSIFTKGHPQKNLLCSSTERWVAFNSEVSLSKVSLTEGGIKLCNLYRVKSRPNLSWNAVELRYTLYLIGNPTKKLFAMLYDCWYFQVVFRYWFA